jgi:cytochrome c5
MATQPAQTGYSSQKIMIATIVVAVVLVAVIWPLSMIGKGDNTAAGDDVETRIQPVARVEMRQAPAAVPGQPRDGATIYATVCKACHEMGVAGAPKTGDKAAWAPRIAQGKAALYASATNGKNAMPPKGGAADLSENELKAAVDYLVGQVK